MNPVILKALLLSIPALGPRLSIHEPLDDIPDPEGGSVDHTDAGRLMKLAEGLASPPSAPLPLRRPQCVCIYIKYYIPVVVMRVYSQPDNSLPTSNP